MTKVYVNISASPSGNFGGVYYNCISMEQMNSVNTQYPLKDAEGADTNFKVSFNGSIMAYLEGWEANGEGINTSFVTTTSAFSRANIKAVIHNTEIGKDYKVEVVASRANDNTVRKSTVRFDDNPSYDLIINHTVQVPEVVSQLYTATKTNLSVEIIKNNTINMYLGGICIDDLITPPVPPTEVTRRFRYKLLVNKEVHNTFETGTAEIYWKAPPPVNPYIWVVTIDNLYTNYYGFSTRNGGYGSVFPTTFNDIPLVNLGEDVADGITVAVDKGDLTMKGWDSDKATIKMTFEDGTVLTNGIYKKNPYSWWTNEGLPTVDNYILTQMEDKLKADNGKKVTVELLPEVYLGTGFVAARNTIGGKDDLGFNRNSAHGYPNLGELFPQDVVINGVNCKITRMMISESGWVAVWLANTKPVQLPEMKLTIGEKTMTLWAIGYSDTDAQWNGTPPGEFLQESKDMWTYLNANIGVHMSWTLKEL